MTEQKILPHLWFDGDAEEAAQCYVRLVAGSKIQTMSRYSEAGVDVHGQPAGRVMNVAFTLGGYNMVALNGGPYFRPTPAVSYFVMFDELGALDHAWETLAQDGSILMPLDAYDWSPRYGWLSDRFGVSWQLSQGSRADIGGQALSPALLFTGERAGHAEAAIRHYTEIFPKSHIEGILRYDGSGSDPAGTIKHAQFYLCGETFMVMDSALEHAFTFTEANAFMVLCDTQAEIDYFWKAMSAEPQAERCGWLKDRFGVSWQILPRALPQMMSEPAAAQRVMSAFMEMGKLDIAALERASAAKF